MSSVASGRAFSRQMRLREVRSRTAQDFDFLFEELVPFAEFAKFSILGPGDTGFLVLFDAFLAQSFVERADVDSEVLRDLRKCYVWATIQRDPHDIVTELFGVTRKASVHPPRPAETSHIECHLDVHQTPGLSKPAPAKRHSEQRRSAPAAIATGASTGVGPRRVDRCVVCDSNNGRDRCAVPDLCPYEDECIEYTVS